MYKRQENEKHSKASKLVVNQIEEDKPKEENKSDSSDLEKKCQKLEKQMKEILAIGRGSQRGRGRGAAKSGKCYGCGQPGHIRANCPAPQQYPYRGRGNGWRGRGRGRGLPFQTHRGRYASNFGASRGRPQFSIGDLGGQWDTGYEEEEWDYDQEYDDYEGHDYQGYQGSGNDPWGRH